MTSKSQLYVSHRFGKTRMVWQDKDDMAFGSPRTTFWSTRTMFWWTRTSLWRGFVLSRVSGGVWGGVIYVSTYVRIGSWPRDRSGKVGRKMMKIGLIFDWIFKSFWEAFWLQHVVPEAAFRGQKSIKKQLRFLYLLFDGLWMVWGGFWFDFWLHF